MFVVTTSVVHGLTPKAETTKVVTTGFHPLERALTHEVSAEMRLYHLRD
jgi:hypothetical protein